MQVGWQLLGIAGMLLLGVMSPGPNFAMVTSAAMNGARRSGMLAALGMSAASGLWALMAVGGIGMVMARWPWIYAAMRWAGAAYLLWLGIRMLIGARKPLSSGAVVELRGLHVFRNAFLVSMTNPKALAFYGSILTVMVPAHAPMWFYATIVVLATAVSAGWYGGLALLFSKGAVRRGFARTKVWVDSVMGVALIAMGGKLLAGR